MSLAWSGRVLVARLRALPVAVLGANIARENFFGGVSRPPHSNDWRSWLVGPAHVPSPLFLKNHAAEKKRPRKTPSREGQKTGPLPQNYISGTLTFWQNCCADLPCGPSLLLHATCFIVLFCFVFLTTLSVPVVA